jgi:hypothetical protein
MFRSRTRVLQSRPIAQLSSCFSQWIQWPADAPDGQRHRLLYPSRTFWLFLGQILAGNISCRQTLQQALAWLCMSSGTIASPNTAAYCKARGRLKLSQIKSIGKQLVKQLSEQCQCAHQWHGHRVLVVDGSSVSMPDTPRNQRRFPQPQRQKDGCGFPVMRIVALFSLTTGVMIDLAHGALTTSERSLFRQLWHHLKREDVILADRGFTSFADFYELGRRGVDAVMRNHQRRSKGVRLIKRLGRGDKLVAWNKTGSCPKWMKKEQWDAMPEEIYVRQIELAVTTPGFRTRNIVIVTTLLDARRYRAKDFIDLYRQRWQAEIFLRDIKTSLGMDVLKCKTPEMILKETAMYQIAYNLIRTLMLEATKRFGGDPLRISFKGVADAVRQWTPIMSMAANTKRQIDSLYDAFIHTIARMKLPWRPNRNEPRAKKRRPKNYQLLNKPRNIFKEIQHRNHYTATLS